CDAIVCVDTARGTRPPATEDRPSSVQPFVSGFALEKTSPFVLGLPAPMYTRPGDVPGSIEMSVPRTTPAAFFWVTESRPSLEERKTQSAAATYVRPVIAGSPDTSRAIDTPSPRIIGCQSWASF